MDYILLMSLIALLYFLRLAIRSEKLAWNGGVCAQTGEQWERFDTDSQGGRMYKSGDYETKMYYCIITWPFIDNNVCANTRDDKET